MSYSVAEIRYEFDRLAIVSNEAWAKSKYFYGQILKHFPLNGRVLEIGCGTGALTRLMAEKASEVIALDLSSQMLSAAQAGSSKFHNIKYLECDFMSWDFPKEHFDFIVSVATLHHLPFEEALMRMQSSLKAGGKIFILDLYEDVGFANSILNGANLCISAALNLFNTKRLRAPKDVRDAWREHEKFDKLMSVDEVRQRAAKILKGVEVKKHYLWRYSLAWKKTSTNR